MEADRLIMNKQKRDNTNIIQWAIPTLLLVLFLLITLLNYNSLMQRESREKVIGKLGSEASSIGEYYEDSLKSLINVVQITANYCAIAGEEELFSEENVALIQQVASRMDVKTAYIQKMDGSAIDQNSANYTKIGSNEVYQTFLDGKAHVTSYIEDTEKEDVLLVTAPIQIDQQVLGTVIFSYQPQKLEEIIDSAEYSTSNVQAFVTDNGKILECVGEDGFGLNVGENLFELMNNRVFLEGSAHIMEQNITNQKSGEVEILDEEGNAKYLIYDPIDNFHSSIVMLINQKQVNRSIYDENRSTQALMYKIIGSIIVFVLILIMINIVSRTKYIKENKELQIKAELDLLTDLLNKIATEKQIKDYLQNEGKNKKSIMFVLDVDNFKKINDTMGHAFGDEVLSTLGKQLRAEFRINDIIGRTGGDEFTIFLKDLSDDATMKREAERVARFFNNFSVGQYTKYSATASIGAAIYPSDATDFESLYKSADQALYKAKKRGKNQLAFYKDEDDKE